MQQKSEEKGGRKEIIFAEHLLILSDLHALAHLIITIASGEY